MLLQFPNPLEPKILPRNIHIYASVTCYPYSTVIKNKKQVLLQPVCYLYAFQSRSLCLLCLCRWPSHTRLLCPTEGEPAHKTQHCRFTTANQKTPSLVRKQEIIFFSSFGTKRTAWAIYTTYRLDGVSSRCR